MLTLNVDSTTLSSVVKKINKVKGAVNSMSSSSVKKSSEAAPLNNKDTEFSDIPMASITSLLLGLDYIFYIWTFLLVGLVTYLSVYKYFQMIRDKKVKNRHIEPQPTTTLYIDRSFITSRNKEITEGIFRLTVNLIVEFLKICRSLLGLVITKVVLRLISSNQSFSPSSAYLWLNNCLKWFYFNTKTTKIINTSILKKLNRVSNDFAFHANRSSIRRSLLVLFFVNFLLIAHFIKIMQGHFYHSII